ncbi:MAG: nuclear transport factor 2 family protein [Candidatus Planktophila sp.]|nr:nuclear transport factor 2 family protein [Candidatus Planktophila sp.]
MDENSQVTASIIREFNSAFNNHDIDAVMALMTDDCIFENTFPAPDGTRHVGNTQVRLELGNFLKSSPLASFEEEELIACDDRCVVRWRYSWGEGHVRGVDVMRVQGGKVSEKLSYVKG